MKRCIISKKGSTLLMVILILSIITTLGVAILGATTMGYAFKVNRNRQMTAMYIAESGLDEAYAYLGEEVENAVSYSRTTYVEEQARLNNTYLAGLSETEYSDAIQNYYKAGFKKYFNDNEAAIISNLTSSKLVAASANGPIGSGNERIVLITASVPPGGQFSDVIDVMRINFSSQATSIGFNGESDGGKQSVTVQLELRIPPYDMPLNRKVKTFEIVRNALWDKAVVSGGDVYVFGNNVQIDGNLYAQGTWNMEKEKIGGVVVGGEDAYTTGTTESRLGKLSVTGDVVTGQYLQTRYSRAGSESLIDISGDAVANSISTQFGEDELNKGSSITVSGDAYIFDDTEINAEASQITIHGNYFGFSPGTGTDHSQSSSLLVNQDDIQGDNGSKLTINGNGGEVTLLKGRTVDEGIYLAGVVYVDQDSTFSYVNNTLTPANGSVQVLSNGMARYDPGISPPASVDFDVRIDTYGDITTKTVTLSTNGDKTVYKNLKDEYQTGDSVSVLGNYLGYNRPVTTPGAEFIYRNLTADKFDRIGSLDLVARTSSGDAMLVADKAKYIGYVYQQEPSDFNLGQPGTPGVGNISIDPLKVVYSLGRYITKAVEYLYDKNGTVGSSLVYMGWNYAHQVNLMGDPQLEDYDNAELADMLPVNSWLTTGWTTANINTSTTTANYYAHGVDDSPLILWGNGANLTPLTALLPSAITLESKPEGIVLSKGNIYVVGQVNMKGLLFSEGDIYFLDDQMKRIENQPLGSPEAPFVSTTNTITLKVFNDLYFKPDASGIGHLFKSVPHSSPADYAWNRKVTSRVTYRDIYVGQASENLNFTGSMERVLRFVDWHWNRH